MPQPAVRESRRANAVPAQNTTAGRPPGATGRLVGISEIAELIGMTRQRAYQIVRDPEFPEPVDVIAAGTFWWRQEVEAYLRKRPVDRRVRAVHVREGRSH
jgi:predicted DNA-binding transcriptional regulator AlpA